jgi:fluoride exporter
VTPADPPGSRDTRGHNVRRRVARALGADDAFPVDPDLDPTDLAGPGRRHRRAPLPVRRSHPGVVGAIAAGGFLGALARYELQLAWPVLPGHFPSSTFVINTSGAFLLGLVLTVTIERDRVRVRRWRSVRLFACVGVLGAWTTMSTVAVEADTLVRHENAATALAYLAATMAAGIAAAAVGTAIGRLHRRVRPAVVIGDGADR